MITCPVTGKTGEPVESVTVRSLVRDELLVADANWFFCSQPDCGVVYFSEDGTTIPKNDLKMRVGIKEQEAPHLVCYCFNHSEESIRKEIEEAGRSTVLQSIAEKVKTGECSCEVMNPKGTCCLGDVRKVVEAAGQVPDETEHDCCSTPLHNEERTGRAGVWAAVASVGTAVVASACCWLPLLLLAFGVSTAGVSAAFETVRPVFLGLTAGLLGLSFYLAHFHKQKSVPGTACKVPNPKLKRLHRAMLWIAVVAVLAMAFFPNYLSFFAGRTSPATIDVRQPTVTLPIQGMTCEGCAVHVKTALEKVPGVESASVDYEKGSAAIVVDDKSQPSKGSLIKAVEQTGYKVNTKGESR